MPKKKMNPAQMSPTTVAMYDTLADGRWHTDDEVLHAGMIAAIERDYGRVVEEGQRIRTKTAARTKAGVPSGEGDPARILLSGARSLARNNITIAQRSGRVERDPNKNRFRMDPQAAKTWRTTRVTGAAPATPAIPAQGGSGTTTRTTGRRTRAAAKQTTVNA